MDDDDIMIPDTDNRDCRVLLDVLMAQGLRDVVLSPGSRNAPLLIAASARRDLVKHIIPDERTAAFVALGMALASRRPVMLVCTSGTALYNYAPAVAEALYAHVPLIVVSADRPQRWIDQDDSQTMRQPGALANIVKRSFNLAVAEGCGVPVPGSRFADERDWYVNRVANEAWITATRHTPGPVHLNIQLDNPPGNTRDYAPSARRIVRVVDNPSNLPPEQLREWAIHLAGKKVLVVAGFMRPDHKLNKALNDFLTLPNVAVCAEPISNLHLPPLSMMVDSLLASEPEEALAELTPDVVISLGGALVSRMLKDFIRGHTPAELYTFNDTDPGIDCMQALTTHFELSALNFLRGVTSLTRWCERKNMLPDRPDYASRWLVARSAVFERNRSFMHRAPWSELLAFDIILASLPEDYNLFLSNGTSVRYGSLLMNRTPHGCYCNRGVSGIDGTNATAAGIAMRYNGPTLLLTGDMSFGYCPQIMGLPQLPENFKIIVVNNSGGGIFRFIRTTRDLPQREQYFCADNPLPLQRLAESFGWRYMLADGQDKLRSLLPDFLNARNALLEIKADPQTSADVLLSFLNQTK